MRMDEERTESSGPLLHTRRCGRVGLDFAPVRGLSDEQREFRIESCPEKDAVRAAFQYSHIDRETLGIRGTPDHLMSGAPATGPPL